MGPKFMEVEAIHCTQEDDLAEWEQQIETNADSRQAEPTANQDEFMVMI